MFAVFLVRFHQGGNTLLLLTSHKFCHKSNLDILAKIIWDVNGSKVMRPYYVMAILPPNTLVGTACSHPGDRKSILLPE